MECLLIVDLQNDFLPGGSLAVPHGDEVCQVIKTFLEKRFPLIVASQDWHPADHSSFASNGKSGRWPIHCVQDTWGASFPADFDSSKVDRIFRKGIDALVDSYSVFMDESGRSSECAAYLLSKQVDSLWVVGLATDYCVKHTVLDALKLGFKTTVVLDGCRGVDLNPGDIERAIEEMGSAGALLVN